MSEPNTPANREPLAGWLCGITAYVIWGLNLLYFKAVGHIPVIEVVLHRVVWSVLMLAAILAFWGGFRAVGRLLRAPGLLVLTALLIAGNWLVYNYAAVTNQALQSSFGYFVTPLTNVVLGVVLLREKLSMQRWLAVALATVGVALQAVALGGVPWISLVLAGTFGGYSLIRKLAKVDGLVGVTVEMVLLLPFALVALYFLAQAGDSHFAAGKWSDDALLITSGLMTAVPMVLFGAAAVRLRLSTLGILQYISPTGQFLLAVLAYGEPLSPLRLGSFALIWVALAIYLIPNVLPQRAEAAAPTTTKS